MKPANPGVRPSLSDLPCSADAVPVEGQHVNRRGFLKFALVSAGAVLTGCGRSPNGSGGRVTLTHWYHQYGETGTQDAVVRYAQEYTKLHPDVDVQVVWVPGDYHTKLATALLTSGGPDIFESQLSVPMVTAEQVVPLDDLFTPETRRDFSERDLASNSVNGKIYGIKMLDDTGVLYYRKSLLDTAGLQPPTTMDGLIDAAKKLTSSTRKGLFLGNDGGISALLTIGPWSAGSDFLVGDKIVFDNPRTVAFYDKLRALNDAGALLIGAPTDWWDPSALTQGLTVMQWGGLWAFPAIHKALGDDVGGMGWPAFDEGGKPVTFLGGWSAMVNAQSRHIEEAKRYVKWLWIDNKKIQQDWCLSYGFHVPPRISAARSAAPLRAPLPALAMKNLEVYGRFLPPAWNSAMNTALTDAVTNILKQGRPAADEIHAAAKKCERELKRLLE